MDQNKGDQSAVNKKMTERFELVFKALKEQQLRISATLREQKLISSDHRRAEKDHKALVMKMN